MYVLEDQFYGGWLDLELYHLRHFVHGFSQRPNPNWHELRKQEKSSSLEPPRSKFYKTQGSQFLPTKTFGNF